MLETVSSHLKATLLPHAWFFLAMRLESPVLKAQEYRNSQLSVITNDSIVEALVVLLSYLGHFIVRPTLVYHLFMFSTQHFVIVNIVIRMSCFVRRGHSCSYVSYRLPKARISKMMTKSLGVLKTSSLLELELTKLNNRHLLFPKYPLRRKVTPNFFS